MLTVRDVLGDLAVRTLAGEAKLDAPVRWVHISELLDPTPWLSGGEFLLTTGMSLDTPKKQREFVKLLADHGLAGIGFGVGFTHQKVPKALLDSAIERDFPLVEVPYELPFLAVTEHAFARLVNEQYALLQRSIAAQERLQQIVLSERGLDAVVAALSTLIGGPALVFDGRGELQAMRTFRRELGESPRCSSSAVSCATARAAVTLAASFPPPADWPRTPSRCRSARPTTRPTAACRAHGSSPPRTVAGSPRSTA